MALRRLWQVLRSFRLARGGNVAVTFALAALPILSGVGAAVDYSRANLIKTKLQAALDSTALLMSKEAATSSSEQLQDNASKYFLAMFNPSDVQSRTLKASYTSENGTTLILNGSAIVPTSFMGVLGVSSVTVTGTSTVKWGSVRLRVALVLDNTGSMKDGGKMDALKAAATNFLDQLKSGASSDGDIYVSVIPFAAGVNVGSVNYTKSWVDWGDYGTCSSKKGSSGTDWAFTSALCKDAGGSWSSYSSSKKSSWTGCVADRGGTNGPTGQNYDTNADEPGSSAPSKFPAVDYYACPKEAMGLGYNWTSMTSLVNSMSPDGGTNQNIGLALGWMSLVGGGPFSVPPTNPAYTYQDIIVLFTDGLNSQSRWYNKQSSIDARQTITCNNVKAAGITLYTVEINTDGSDKSALLQNCASDDTKYFFLTSASELVTTFSQIGNNLTNLRIAK